MTAEHNRVLVVEDNENNMILMRYTLERGGYEVVPALTGEEGVRLCAENKYAFIIMDILLPGIDGLECTRQIRAGGKNQETPIIAMTSMAMTGDRETILAAGCDGYIEKPFDPLTVLAQIQEILSQLR